MKRLFCRFIVSATIFTLSQVVARVVKRKPNIPSESRNLLENNLRRINMDKLIASLVNVLVRKRDKKVLDKAREILRKDDANDVYFVNSLGSEELLKLAKIGGLIAHD